MEIGDPTLSHNKGATKADFGHILKIFRPGDSQEPKLSGNVFFVGIGGLESKLGQITHR